MAEIPELFTNPADKLNSLSQLIANSIINEAGQEAINEGADSISTEPNYLSVTAHRANNKGLLDLKPYFATSSNVKQTKNGGWYMVVPIRRKVRSMSYNVYQQAKAIDMTNSDMSTRAINGLYSNQQSSIPLLNYAPKSNNLTRIKNNVGNGTQYIAFRTVSNKSNPASWIINRGLATEDNMSKTLLTNIERLIKYRLSHLND